MFTTLKEGLENYNIVFKSDDSIIEASKKKLMSL